MKNVVHLVPISLFALSLGAAEIQDYPIRPVPFTTVKGGGQFLDPADGHQSRDHGVV